MDNEMVNLIEAPINIGICSADVNLHLQILSSLPVSSQLRIAALT